MCNGETKRIEKISVVDQVGEAIKEKILSGEWRPGEKLPSEAEIAHMYGVNRLSVRMALQRFITLGVIETRVGEGSFVKPFSFYPVLNEITDYYVGGSRAEDIQQMRYLIETASAIRAAALMTEEDKVQLKEYLDRYESTCRQYDETESEEDLVQSVDADFDFHAWIVHLSRNRLFEEIYYLIRKLITEHMTSMITYRKYKEKVSGEVYLKAHEDLFSSICANDREKLGAAIHQILDMDPAADLR